jgi:hypothetical protein
VGVAIFFLLALIAAGIIAYPLLPGRLVAQPEPAVTDGDIERAVRDLRQAPSTGGPSCPTCARAYQAGDRFCVRCGSGLPQPASAGPVCPSCGVVVHEGDLFCAKCGHRMASEEAA